MKKEEQNVEDNTKKMEEEKQRVYKFYSIMNYPQFIEHSQEYVRKAGEKTKEFTTKIENEQQVMLELLLAGGMGCLTKVTAQMIKLKKTREEKLLWCNKVEKVIESYDSIIEEHKQREKRNKN